MSEIFQRRTLTGWVPANAESEAEWRKQKLGQVYRAKVTKPRNYKHHCLFMVLLEQTFHNQERYTNDRDFRRAVADAAGWVDEYVTLDGEVRRSAKSYSYDELPDEAEFTKEFGKAMTVCAAILSLTAPELEAEVSRYADENYGIECPRIFREQAQERAA
jgi:hypothetical protein